MAIDKKHESMSSLKASTERYKQHNDRVASGARIAGRKLHGSELSCTEAMGEVMTGAQAVAAMTGAGVPLEQLELRKVILELENVWSSIDATLKRCRVLLETMKGGSPDGL